MPDADKFFRQHVAEEAPAELLASQFHELCFVVIGAIFIAEGDVAVIDAFDSVIADGDPVRVIAEVFKDLFGTGKWLFGINDPISFGGLDE